MPPTSAASTTSPQNTYSRLRSYNWKKNLSQRRKSDGRQSEAAKPVTEGEHIRNVCDGFVLSAVRSE